MNSKGSNAQAFPSADQVESIFDALAQGRALHHGYWAGGYREDAGATPWSDAADHLTDLFIDKAALRPGAHLFDLGCGNGQPVVRAARTKGVRVTGITVNAEHLAAATRLANETGLADSLRFDLVDGARLPYPEGSFHAAWAMQSVVQIVDQAAAIREVHRILEPGGQFVLGDIITRARLPEEYAAVWTGTTAHTLNSLTALVSEAGFEILEVTDLTAQTRCMVSWYVDELLRELDELAGVEPAAVGTYQQRYLGDIAAKHGPGPAQLIAAVAEYRKHPDYARNEESMGFMLLQARKKQS